MKQVVETTPDVDDAREPPVEAAIVRAEQRDEHSLTAKRVDLAGANGAEPSVPRGIAARLRESLAATRDAVQTLGLSAALWTLYVPHHLLLRALGPRLGMAWVYCAAHIHWALSFVGAQRPARESLAAMAPHFQTRLSVSQILRRHLLMKHQCFARARVYSVKANADSQQRLRWTCNEQCRDALPRPDRKEGMIVVGYHFNYYQSFAAGLADYFPGVDLVQLRYKTWRCVERAASPITRLAMRKAIDADRRAHARVFYIDDFEAIVDLYRLLRGGGVAAVTADGGAASDYVDVRFFDGTFRAPAGWAKLAAATNSSVLLACDRDADERTRDGRFYDHVDCSKSGGSSPEEAVAAAIRVLEQMIREEPWGWHPWQRLRVDVGTDGARRYSLKQYGFHEGQRLKNAPAPEASPRDRNDPPRDQRKVGKASAARPRVAVVANSYPPYRTYLHSQLVLNVPEVELWSLSTHSNAYERWKGLTPPDQIRRVEFSGGEPTNEQPYVRHAVREWRKGGRIIEWLQKNEVAAVFVQGCGDMGRVRILRWCHRRGIPCFLTGDFNVRSDRHPPLKQWLKRRVYSRGVQWAAGLMPCGTYGRDLLCNYGGASKPCWPFPFVPHVDLYQRTSRELAEQMAERFDLQPGRRRMVFSGRMMRAKRPDLAIDAFATLAHERPEWDLVMTGEGHLRRDMEERVPPELRHRVVWTGFLHSGEEVAGVYANADMLLLPSDHEPWGVVVVEAAAAGLAIVASDNVGAVPELVHSQVNGAVFPSGDLGELINMLRNVTSHDVIDRMRDGSMKVFQQWTAEADPVKSFRAALRHADIVPA